METREDSTEVSVTTPAKLGVESSGVTTDVLSAEDCETSVRPELLEAEREDDASVDEGEDTPERGPEPSSDAKTGGG